jgi:hypothetical protein
LAWRNDTFVFSDAGLELRMLSPEFPELSKLASFAAIPQHMLDAVALKLATFVWRTSAG